MPSIPEYPPAAQPLDGSELVPIWQNGKQVASQAKKLTDSVSAAIISDIQEAQSNVDAGVVAIGDAVNATASDRVQTGLDRAQTGLDRDAAAASAGAATIAASVLTLQIQTNPVTPSTPPAGSTSGGYYWSVDAAVARKITLYQNTSGAGAPTSPAISLPVNTLLIKSPLMRTGISGTPAYVFPDGNGAYVLGQVNTDGTWFISLHPDSPAYALIVSKIAAAIQAGGFQPKSSLGRIIGTAAGSPSMDGALMVARDSAGLPMFAVGRDLTLWQAKYDSRITKAVAAAERIEQGPVPVIDGTGVVLLYDGARRNIWPSATAKNARFGSNGNFTFTDTVQRGIERGYSVTIDGTVRAITRDVAFDAFTAAGHSALLGKYTPLTADTAPFAPGRFMMLSDRPVVDVDVAPRSGTATLVDGQEVSTETFFTSFMRSRVARLGGSRPNTKLVGYGSAKQSQRTIASYETGTQVSNDLMLSADRVIAASGKAASYDGPVIVRAHILRFGDGVTVSQAAAIVSYRANYEALIRAKTGQIEPVPLIIHATATQQKFAAADSGGPFPVINYVGHLDALAASLASDKIYVSVAEYIGQFTTDNQHPETVSQSLFGEYDEKCEDVVNGQGRDWVGVRPRPVAEWTITTSYVDIPFDVQVGPLVLDTYFCTDPGNLGFQLSDSNGRTINGTPTVQPGNKVRLPLSGALGATWTIAYADTNGTAGMSGNTAGARGCLRDSDPAMARDGVTHLYNPCLPFRQANP